MILHRNFSHSIYHLLAKSLILTALYVLQSKSAGRIKEVSLMSLRARFVQRHADISIRCFHASFCDGNSFYRCQPVLEIIILR